MCCIVKKCLFCYCLLLLLFFYCCLVGCVEQIKPPFLALVCQRVWHCPEGCCHPDNNHLQAVNVLLAGAGSVRIRISKFRISKTYENYLLYLKVGHQKKMKYFNTFMLLFNPLAPVAEAPHSCVNCCPHSCAKSAQCTPDTVTGA